MASDFEKPDKVHTLFAGEIREKMWPLPVRDLFSVGGSSEKKLLKYGVRTIGELAAMDRKRLVKDMGLQGGVIWEYANGIESVPIVQRETKEKSYGNSITTSQDIGSCETGLPDADAPVRDGRHAAASGFHESEYGYRAGDRL